ncbi:MAG: ribonuclease HI [Clostridia bacterium]
MKKVILYTDGACSGNPGPGGYGAILIYNGIEKEISGGEKSTTNNKMEMMAVIKGLEMLKEPCEVEVYSDSAYVVNSIEKGWIYSWKKNGWKKADKKEVKNVDLWERLLKQLDIHKVTFNKVKGHSNDELNNRCDRLAVSEREKFA